jgi:dihydroorotate dehydrogenase
VLASTDSQSNHGGRQVDYSPAPIDILYELRCLRPHLFARIEIMADGGVRSGADVVKLLALGARAVGLGRSIVYANATHGQQGVRRVIESECLLPPALLTAATVLREESQTRCATLAPPRSTI